MITRILPKEEYGRLERTGIPQLPKVRSEDVTIVVVEDEEKIIASMMVLRATYFEGAWIDPDHRNAGVTRGLLDLASEVAQMRGSQWVFVGAADDHMRSILDRLGAAKLPMDSYILNVGGA